MALTVLFLVSVLTIVHVDQALADIPITSVKPNAEAKRRNDVVDIAFLEQKDVLLDMLESKLKEVRDKKKKKPERSESNKDSVKCDSQPGNVDLKLKAKGISGVGDTEVQLKFGNSGKATLNLDASGISNVGKARLDLGVDEGGLYVPGLSNLFVGKSYLNNCSNQRDTDAEQINSTLHNRRSRTDIVNATISNDVNKVDGGPITEVGVNETTVVNNITPLLNNNTASSIAIDQVNATSTVAAATVAQNVTEATTTTVKS